MNWLLAALAFALVMLVFATIVTILLEAGYRVLSTRERGFRLMMERLFDEVLRPRVARSLGGVTIEQARRRFVAAVTSNQGYETKPGVIRSIAQPGTLSSMTMMQFADRLADTDVGKAIARSGAAHIDVAINDLAQKLERFGAAASQRFKDQAGFWCIVASVALAFVANVDAVRVFQSLLRDRDLTNSLIAAYGGSVADGAQRPPSIKEMFESIDALEDGSFVTREEATKFKEDLASAQLKIVDLKSTGLPITIDAWPFCTGVAGEPGREATRDVPAIRVPADSKCTKITTLDHWEVDATHSEEGWSELLKRIASRDGVAWFLSVLLGGLLIGLGAPFWFDLARGLTRSTELLRAVGVQDGADKPKPPAASGAPDAGTSRPPRTPVEAFTVALAAKATAARSRVLLGATGKPVRGA